MFQRTARGKKEGEIDFPRSWCFQNCFGEVETGYYFRYFAPALLCCEVTCSCEAAESSVSYPWSRRTSSRVEAKAEQILVSQGKGATSSVPL